MQINQLQTQIINLFESNDSLAIKKLPAEFFTNLDKIFRDLLPTQTHSEAPTTTSPHHSNQANIAGAYFNIGNQIENLSANKAVFALAASCNDNLNVINKIQSIYNTQVEYYKSELLDTSDLTQAFTELVKSKPSEEQWKTYNTQVEYYKSKGWDTDDLTQVFTELVKSNPSPEELEARIKIYNTQAEYYKSKNCSIGFLIQVFKELVKSNPSEEQWKTYNTQVKYYKLQGWYTGELMQAFKELVKSNPSPEELKARIKIYNTQVEYYKFCKWYTGHLIQVFKELVKSNPSEEQWKTYNTQVEYYKSKNWATGHLTQAFTELVKSKPSPEELEARIKIYNTQVEYYKSKLWGTVDLTQVFTELVKSKPSPEELEARIKIYNTQVEYYKTCKLYIGRLTQVFIELVKSNPSPEELEARIKIYNTQVEYYKSINYPIVFLIQTFTELVKSKPSEEQWKTYNTQVEYYKSKGWDTDDLTQVFTELVNLTQVFTELVKSNSSNASCKDFNNFISSMLKEIIGSDQNPREPSEVNKLIKQFEKSLLPYLKNSNEVNWEDLESILNITHDNFPLVLDAIRAQASSLKEFIPLLEAIPYNNTFTRIVRMLGEPQDIGGYLEFVQTLSNKARANLLSTIQEFATKHGKSSTEHVFALLEILENKAKSQNINTWSQVYWNTLKEDINNYKSSVYELLNPKLFSIYEKIKSNRSEVAQFKSNLEQELNNLTTGKFFGVSQKFQDKYNFSHQDTLALFHRFLPINGLNSRDYAPTLVNIQNVLNNRGTRAWQAEIDDGLREGMFFGADGVELNYNGTIDSARDQGLLELISSEDLVSAYKEYASDENPKKLKQAIVNEVINFKKLDSKALSQTAQGNQGRREWLKAWDTLLNDSLKHDAYNHLKDKLAKLEQPIKQEGLNREHLLAQSNLFSKVNNNVVNAIKRFTTDKEKNKLDVAIEFAKLFSNISLDDLNNQETFNTWKGQIIDPLSQLYSRRLTRDGIAPPGDLNEILSNSLDQARLISLQSRTPGARAMKLINKLFKEDREYISKELERYQEVKQPGEGEELKVSYNDDLLHLMEFITSGVCTWVSRPNQINDRDFHFGNISIKDDKDRFLAVSQVQLSPVSIHGLPEAKSAKGFSVMALPGLYMDTTQKALDKETAFKMMLGFAQKQAKQLGMQGAVVPVYPAIHGQNKSDQAMIQSFKDRGWLVEKTLESSIKLSGQEANSYNYNQVYLVKIPEEELNQLTSEIKENSPGSVFGADVLKKLQAESRTNENAYLQLELVRALLAYENYPGIPNPLESINQWNGFLSVMDNADPKILIQNYITILKQKNVTTQQAQELARQIAEQDISSLPNLSVLRDIVKVFFLNNVAFITDSNTAGQSQRIDKFKFFDRSDELNTLRNDILGASSEQDLSQKLRALIQLILVKVDLVNNEMTKIIDTKFAETFINSNQDDRTIKLEKFLEELLKRRIGSKSLNAIKNHLKAIRGTENIPPVEIFTQELDSDADDQGFLRSPVDLYAGLFRFQDDSNDGDILA